MGLNILDDSQLNIKEEEADIPDPRLTRRKFLKQCLFRGLGAFCLGLGGYSFLCEPYLVKIEKLSLSVPHLPAYWVGKKIAFISDLHSSPEVRPSFFENAFSLINGEKPDVILMAGDYVTGSVRYMEPLARELRKLNPAGEADGKIAVLGNHDYWTDSKKVTDGLERAGFRVTVNERVKLGPAGSELYIMGTDDLWSGAISLPALYRDLDINKIASIVLTHNPDIFPVAAEDGIPVILAGHTHGGQVYIPLIGAPISPSPFVRGFYRRGKTLMYVTRGLGLISPAVRFNCPPEISLFTLSEG